MSCNFSIVYPYPKEGAIQKIKEAVLSRSGTFDGNISSGKLEISFLMGSFKVE